MKIIRLTDQQRRLITERRRQAQDRRIYQRLSAVFWSDAGRTREEIAELSGVSTRQVGQWLRIFRNKGLDALCTLHYRGDPGRLRPAQVERLKQEIAKGGFHNADQVRRGSAVTDLVRRGSAVTDLVFCLSCRGSAVTSWLRGDRPGDIVAPR
jgi:transposase